MSLESEEGPHAFAVFVQRLADGEAHADASRQLHELMTTLARHAETCGGTAKGRMTFTFDFVLADSTVEVRYELGTKVPKPRRPKGVFWLTKGNNLTNRNLRQKDLFPRAVDTSAGAPEATPPRAKEV